MLDLIVTKLLGGAHRAVAGVVHHDVDALVPLQNSVQEAGQFISIAHVETLDDETRTVRIDEIVQRALAPYGGDDVIAFGQRTLDEVAAEPARGSGDQPVRR
jgi:hypothetical protein